jgi:hypothetical protein
MLAKVDGGTVRLPFLSVAAKNIASGSLHTQS